MSLAIVNNSSSSHCGAAVSPRAPSPTLAGQEASSACISRFGERPFRLRKGMPLTQSATAFLKDLSGRACASPSAYLEKLRPTAQQASPSYVQGPFHSGEATAAHSDCDSGSGAFCANPADRPLRQAGPGPYTGEGPRLEREPSDKRRGPGSKPRAPAQVWQPAVSY